MGSRFHRFDDGGKRAVHRTSHAVLVAQGSDGSVHVIDLSRATAQQVLLHRGDVARRRECLVDLLHEVDLEGRSLSRGDGHAFINHQLFQRVELRIGDAADFAAKNRGDWVHHTVEDRLMPNISSDVRRDAALQASGREHVGDSAASLISLDDSVTGGHVFDRAGSLENRAELGDAAENKPAPTQGAASDLLAAESVLE